MAPAYEGADRARSGGRAPDYTAPRTTPHTTLHLNQSRKALRQRKLRRRGRGLGSVALPALCHPRLLHAIPESSLTYSVPLFLKRHCDRTPQAARSWLRTSARPPRCTPRIFQSRLSIQNKRGEGLPSLSLCATAHPLHTSFASIFGGPVSDTAVRTAPSPRTRGRLRPLASATTAAVAVGESIIKCQHSSRRAQ